MPGRADPIVLPDALAGPAAPAADPRRGAPLRDHLPPPAPRRRARASRCSTSSRASARRAAARCCSTSARPSGSLAATAGGARGRAGRAGEDRAPDLRAAAPDGPSVRRAGARPRPAAVAVARAGCGELVDSEADATTSTVLGAAARPVPGEGGASAIHAGGPRSRTAVVLWRTRRARPRYHRSRRSGVDGPEPPAKAGRGCEPAARRSARTPGETARGAHPAVAVGS